ncbi:glutamyl-tRNA amidotransferase subunit A [Tistrella bauzanensis]|uniref:Glutamyl-tRNA amidotransferase subunit A n=1 Tax=Tistrella bauzanensis TaxID=657419 RepID=A0ABQ1IJK3_9PROT|nr:amidase family protein [Tistrella bauzanensis]GGB44182.1 glutamyl-tRNA amidotransferase subunit A [Tistrella bauzanensis]
MPRTDTSSGTDLTAMTARDLAAAIRSRAMSPVEVTEAVLARIEARADLNAFITVTAREARAEARAAEALVMASDDPASLPPLLGVPYSVKDLTATRGVRTTMGSAIFADNVPGEDAVAVARARAAGAILIGKTTTPEFGHKQAADAPIFGRTLNPIDPTVTCGASSSGAAVAVAAGMGPIALGTDGGGSIRIPAACCGIVGLKATLGRIPHLALPDLFAANSFVGPMARDVADTRLLFDAISGLDARDPWGQGALPAERRITTLEGLKVAYLPRCGTRVDPRVLAATDAVITRMAQAGAQIHEIEIDFAAEERHFLVVLQSGLAARVGPHLARFRDRMDPSLVMTIEKGMAHSAIDFQAAAAARTAIFTRIQAELSRADVIISPTLTAPPLPVDQDPNGIVTIDGEPAGTIRGAWYPYTFPLNLTGHPALSMPCGTTPDDHLPIGLQIIGRWHDDHFILDVAGLVEALDGPRA